MVKNVSPCKPGIPGNKVHKLANSNYINTKLLSFIKLCTCEKLISHHNDIRLLAVVRFKKWKMVVSFVMPHSSYHSSY